MNVLLVLHLMAKEIALFLFYLVGAVCWILFIIEISETWRNGK